MKPTPSRPTPERFLSRWSRLKRAHERDAPDDASDGDMPGVLIARDAEVKKDTLTWKSGADDTAKNAGIADLAALGIIVRS